MHGQVIPYPNCSLSAPLTIPGYVAKPAQPAQKPRAIGRKTNGDYYALGFILALVGILICLSCYGITIGLILMACGAALSRGKKCSECGSKTSREARICPGCGCEFR